MQAGPIKIVSQRLLAMCGRYVITSTPEAIRALFGYGEQPNFPPRYNVAPTQPIPVVRVDQERKGLRFLDP